MFCMRLRTISVDQLVSLGAHSKDETVHGGRSATLHDADTRGDQLPAPAPDNTQGPEIGQRVPR